MQYMVYGLNTAWKLQVWPLRVCHIVRFNSVIAPSTFVAICTCKWSISGWVGIICPFFSVTGRPPLEEVFAARRQAVSQPYLFFLELPIVTMNYLSLPAGFSFFRANVKMINHARCEQQIAHLLHSTYSYFSTCLDRHTYIASLTSKWFRDWWYDVVLCLRVVNNSMVTTLILLERQTTLSKFSCVQDVFGSAVSLLVPSYRRSCPCLTIYVGK
jgi:hypothetical protein